MTDEEALDLIIKCHTMLNDNTFGVIVDLNYIVVAEDAMSAKMTNTESGSFIGRKIFPDISTTKWRSDIVEKNLLDCLTTRKTNKWLSLRFSRQIEYWLIILSYAPIINLATNNVIAYKISGEKITYPLAFYKLDQIINSSQDDLQTRSKGKKLHALIGAAILFLIFHCENYQQIANLLSLSLGKNITKSMVSKVISRTLYPQFNVVNLESLKSKAHKSGYHKQVPASLLGEFMFPLDKL